MSRYPTGHLEFYKGAQCILKEYSRDDTQKNGHSTPIAYAARQYELIEGGCRIHARFEGKAGEKIFGMGQYQQDVADLKGCVLELRQRNSQISILFPFLKSGRKF